MPIGCRTFALTVDRPRAMPAYSRNGDFERGRDLGVQAPVAAVGVSGARGRNGAEILKSV